MKAIIKLTNGKRIERTANYSKIQQEINIDRIVWKAYRTEGGPAVWEVPQKVLKSITIQL